MPPICLTMIVKNEAHVIERCLRSVLPFIDSWCIVDTGSTDGTQALIRQILADIPGELHERPWRNFGHNRTEAIALARGYFNDLRSEIRDPSSTYLLFLDADEVIEAPKDFKVPNLTADAYQMQIRLGDITFCRPLIVSTRLPWRYEGVLHEYLATDHPYTSERMDGPVVVSRGDGGRSQGIDVAEKYRRDAAVLEEALKSEPDNRRYVFYLAQSYRDSNQREKTIEAYQRRAEMGGWEEETWYSLFQIARLTERLLTTSNFVESSHPSSLIPHPFRSSAALVVERYLAAYQFRPSRAEPLVCLAAFHRERNEFALAHLYSARAIAIPKPDDILFVDTPCYAWRAKDEYSIACYYMGLHEESKRICDTLLSNPDLPDAERDRVAKNLDFAVTALARKAA